MSVLQPWYGLAVRSRGLRRRRRRRIAEQLRDAVAHRGAQVAQRPGAEAAGLLAAYDMDEVSYFREGEPRLTARSRPCSAAASAFCALSMAMGALGPSSGLDRSAIGCVWFLPRQPHQS